MKSSSFVRSEKCLTSYLRTNEGNKQCKQGMHGKRMKEISSFVRTNEGTKVIDSLRRYDTVHMMQDNVSKVFITFEGNIYLRKYLIILLIRSLANNNTK